MTTLAMKIAIKILQTQMTAALGIFNYSTICLIDKVISARCCLSYKNQSFDLHCKSNVLFLYQKTLDLTGLNGKKEDKLLTKNFWVITEKPSKPS